MRTAINRHSATLHAFMDPVAPAALEIARAISREDMAKLPIPATRQGAPGGDARDLDEALADLRQESIAGLDTETRPAFKKARAICPRSSRSRPRAVYLFQLRRTEVFPGARRAPLRSAHLKAGVSLADDLRALAKKVFRSRKRTCSIWGSSRAAVV